MSFRPQRRNDIPLLTWIDGAPVSHFRLHEFETHAGWVMLARSVLTALELMRRDLNHDATGEVWIVITGGTRTPQTNAALAARLGWIDQGGLVSRDSKHLEAYGGIAVDFYAMLANNRARVSQERTAEIARRYFDFVKADYADGHIHADQRTRGI